MASIKAVAAGNRVTGILLVVVFGRGDGFSRGRICMPVYNAVVKTTPRRVGHFDASMGEFLLAMTRLNSGCLVLGITFGMVLDLAIEISD